MFKRLKLELFYIKRLLQEGYGPSYWWPYFKNRFFGDILASRVPPVSCKPRSDFAVHILSQKHALWMLIWVIKSFLYYSKLCPQIIIHDEGSFDAKTVKLLESKFSNLKIVTRQEADRKIMSRTDLTDAFKKYRNAGNNILLKLTDIILLSEAKKIMVLDNDILFLGTPTEIIDFVEGRSLYDALITEGSRMNIGIKDDYAAKYKIYEQKADFVNTGIVLFNKEVFSVKKLFEYFDNTLLDPHDYFIEAAGYSCLLAQCNFGLLPGDKYKVKGIPQDNDVIKHFTSARRYELYAYGIDMIRKKILEKSIN